MAGRRVSCTEELARTIDELPLPGVVEAVLSDGIEPLASPFVEPYRVRFAFEAEIERGR
jgi:hypothetical protein